MEALRARSSPLLLIPASIAGGWLFAFPPAEILSSLADHLPGILPFSDSWPWLVLASTVPCAILGASAVLLTRRVGKYDIRSRAAAGICFVIGIFGWAVALAFLPPIGISTLFGLLLGCIATAIAVGYFNLAMVAAANGNWRLTALMLAWAFAGLAAETFWLVLGLFGIA